MQFSSPASGGATARKYKRLDRVSEPDNSPSAAIAAIARAAKRPRRIRWQDGAAVMCFCRARHLGT
mgnify:CR=1 FL=1